MDEKNFTDVEEAEDLGTFESSDNIRGIFLATGTELRNRWNVSVRNMSYSQYAFTHTLLNGKAFNVNDYPFQKDILDDLCPDLALIKISQVGATEIQTRKGAIFAKRNPGVNVLYIVPDDKLFKTVSQGRLKPLFEQNSIFSKTDDDGNRQTRNMSRYQIGTSSLLISAITESAATSQPADFLMMDEFDLADQDVLVLFNSRLQNSQYKIIQRFCTPTFAGYGIHLEYSESDQREYIAPCDVCRFENVPYFSRKCIHIPNLPDKVEDLLSLTRAQIKFLNIRDSYVKCERCGSKLDLAHPKRMWVPKRPGIDKHGYYIRPFTSTRITLPYIFKQFDEYQKNGYIRGFVNTVIGEAYTSEDMRISEPTAKRCFLPHAGAVEIGKTVSVSIGIDLGHICHIVLGVETDNEVFMFFDYITVKAGELLSTVVSLLKQYNITSGGIDRNPYTITADEITTLSGGRIWSIEYIRGAEIVPVKDEFGNPKFFRADRTSLLDGLYSRLRKHTIAFAGYTDRQQEIINHLRDLVRDQENNLAIYKKLTGDDHWAHAMAYCLYGVRAVNLLRLQSKVETRTQVLMSSVNLASPAYLIGA